LKRVIEFLRYLHHRGRLVPLLREAAVEEFLLQQARQAGLSVSTEELQCAADAARRRQGLASAEQTQAWLQRQRLSVVEFEDALERDLLIEKLKDHLSRERIAGHFAANSSGYTLARLRLIVVPSEDQARELLSQLREEDHDFSELARQHSQHPSCGQGGLIHARRRQLAPVLAEAVFAAKQGNIVGPLAMADGFVLALVESLTPAALDAQTTSLIRQELFDAWLADTLKGLPLTFPLLDAL
jgi:parvulin-like peptidyl-prolyl isomerase